MSTFIRRYSRYLNEKAFAYRQLSFDFGRVKKGYGIFFFFNLLTLLSCMIIWTLILLTVLGLYVPECYLSINYNKKHPIEEVLVHGVNLVAFNMALGQVHGLI